MSKIYMTNKAGITYVYEQTPFYDPEKKQSRPKKKYLGRLDPETGEIIQTAGKRIRTKKHEESDNDEVASLSASVKRLNEIVVDQKKKIQSLESEIDRLKKERDEANALLAKASRILGG